MFRLFLILLLLLGVAGRSVASISTVFDFESIVVPQGEPRVDFPDPLTLSQDGFDMTSRIRTASR